MARILFLIFDMGFELQSLFLLVVGKLLFEMQSFYHVRTILQHNFHPRHLTNLR